MSDISLSTHVSDSSGVGVSNSIVVVNGTSHVLIVQSSLKILASPYHSLITTHLSVRSSRGKIPSNTHDAGTAPVIFAGEVIKPGSSKSFITTLLPNDVLVENGGFGIIASDSSSNVGNGGTGPVVVVQAVHGFSEGVGWVSVGGVHPIRKIDSKLAVTRRYFLLCIIIWFIEDKTT